MIDPLNPLGLLGQVPGQVAQARQAQQDMLDAQRKAALIAQAPPQRPNWQAQLFGGQDPLQGGMLQAPEASGLGRNALMQAGINLLQNSGPSPYRRGLGELLGTALGAGQQAYQQGTEHALSNQGMMAQRQSQQRIAQIRQRYQGRTDPASLQGMFHDFLLEGSPESIKAASALSEYLKSQRENATRGVPVATVGPDGRPITQFVDPTDGRQIGSPLARIEPVDPNAAMNSRLDMQDATQFVGIHLDPKVRAAVRNYHLFQNHLHEAASGNPEAYKSLISAFAANADPNNQLRLGMLQYLSELDPSAEGRARILVSKLQSGTIPASDLKNLESIIQGNYENSRKQYEDAYTEQMQRTPGARRHIPAPDAIFGPRTNTGSGGTTASGMRKPGGP